MSLCFAFLCNDASLSAVARIPFREQLTLDDGAPYGWGLGYYQQRQPLLRKAPKGPDGALDFCDEADQLKTSLLLGHVRATSTGGQRNENTQPFRFRSWTFVLSGSVEAASAVREELVKAIPDFIQRNMKGSTPSELVFHLFLAFLNDTGKIDDPRPLGNIVGRALYSTMTYLDRVIEGDPPTYCCLLTNGYVVVAAHRGVPLSLTRNEAYQNVGLGPDDKPLSYPHLRSVALLGAKDPPPGWETIDESSVVLVDNDLNIELESFSTE